MAKEDKITTAIGICACKRPHDLAMAIKGVKKHSVTEPFLFAALDGPDEACEKVLDDYEIPAIISPWTGVANNKNVILSVLRHYDFGFIFEDDLRVKKEGWDLAYVTLWQKTGIHHFGFLPKASYRDDMWILKKVKTDSDLLPEYLHLSMTYNKPGGLLMAMSQQVIEAVGGFWNGYNPYGAEHGDWTSRARRAGLIVPEEKFDAVSFWEDTEFLSRPERRAVWNAKKKAEYIEVVRIKWLKRKNKCPVYEPIEYNPNIVRKGNWECHAEKLAAKELARD